MGANVSGERVAHIKFHRKTREERNMLKTFVVALLAIAMSVGLAQAKGHKHTIAGCAVGQQAAGTCACGTAANGRPLLCQKGQWCHYPALKTCTQ
jgi:hypothetical protein